VFKYIEHRDVPICDFCTAKEAVFQYTARGKVLEEMFANIKPQGVELHEGDALWGCCDLCAPFVDRASEDKEKVLDLVKHVLQYKPEDPEIPELFLTAAYLMIYGELMPLTGKTTVKMAGPCIFEAEGSEKFIQRVREGRKRLEDNLNRSSDPDPCEAGLVKVCGKVPTKLCQCCGLHLCEDHQHKERRV
jgi:hypothetical protein